MAETNALNQIVDKVKDSNNILVTVNTNPSVDELSAALGITLLLNKLDKHATAVFSGDVPPAIDFLKPDKTFEHTVDSLRDFIIALDKEKADHLRYKVEGDMVKIFITPYRTTINDKDLDFSQGDYNVETVLAIGVKSEKDLDHALESHGKILHDATVTSISLSAPSNLGGIEWTDASASSYSEMLYSLAEKVVAGRGDIDEQIANAFLTGIVAATDRFSNSKTSSNVMTIAAQLMAAGANQQLIATKLEEEHQITEKPQKIEKAKEVSSEKIIKKDADEPKKEEKSDDGGAGALVISHVPEGDVDEVAKQVATDKSDDAYDHAQEALAKQSSTDAAEAAEQKLAEQLATSTKAVPATNGLPSVADLQKDIARASETAPAVPAPSPAPAPMHGAVSDDAWKKSRTEEEASAPSLGGTLNATTEQAEEDKRRQIEEDRNRTILTHGGSYTADTPAFQAPLNATAALSQTPDEPDIHDVFEGQSTVSTNSHAAAIQPPAPNAPTPTLAEIDAQNRVAHTDARDAVSAALDGAAPQPAPEAAATDMPPLPPLPPMPDFSTLPPLPGAEQPPQVSIPDNLGAQLAPPATPVQPQPAQTGDPAQFKIPGQP